MEVCRRRTFLFDHPHENIKPAKSFEFIDYLELGLIQGVAQVDYPFSATAKGWPFLRPRAKGKRAGSTKRVAVP